MLYCFDEIYKFLLLPLTKDLYLENVKSLVNSIYSIF